MCHLAGGGRYRRNLAFDTRTKIVDHDALPEIAGRVHLAKGWFDVLSAEHGRLLGGAKSSGGTLVVVVYGDAASRPVPLDAYDRAQMIAALECVDIVCVCDASLEQAVAAALKPATVLDIDALQSRDLVRDVLARHAAG